MAARSSVPVAVQQAVSFTGAMLNLVCGYFLLRGKNWARILAIIVSVGILAFSFVISPIKVALFFGAPLVLLEAFFLLRRGASEFFAAVGAGAAIDNELSWRRIASNCCYIAAGMFLGGMSIIAFMKFPEFETERLSSLPGKWFMLGIISVLPLVCLIVGQAISDGFSRRRELGIVLLASAAVGLLMFLTVTVVTRDSDWQDSLPADKRSQPNDYWNGFSWLGLLGGVGALSLYAGRARKTVQSKSTRSRGVPRP